VALVGRDRGSKQAGNTMPNQSTQKVTQLTDVDQERLREQRAVIEQCLGDDESRKRYQTTAGKLGTIRAILNANLPGRSFNRTRQYWRLKENAGKAGG
jgi:hypothetical protein